MKYISPVFVAFAVIKLSFALALTSIPRSILPVVPNQDPFYQPPTGYATQPPGTVLRTRSIDASIFGLLPEPVEAWQLLYRTTASNETPIATVTTVLKPLVVAHSDRFISFQTAYDCIAPQCRPSYTYQLGASQPDIVTDVEILLVQAYLASGYIVAAPDWEGPDDAFGAGHLAAMTTLDGIRAVSGSFGQNTLGFSKTQMPSVVGVGYSGAGSATGWAAALQHSYAPELPIMKGWAMGGPFANLTSQIIYDDGTLFSGFLLPLLDGLAKPSAFGPQLNPLYERILTTKGRKALDQANKFGANADLLIFFGQRVLSTDFQTLGERLLYDTTFRSVLDKNSLVSNKNEKPVVPIFAYHATQDEAAPYAPAAQLVDMWCSEGVSINFTTFASGGHVSTDIVGLPDVMGFVTSAFAGKVAKGCSRSTKLGNALDPVALGVELEPILTRLVDALIDVGKGDQNVLKDLHVLSDTVATMNDTEKRAN